MDSQRYNMTTRTFIRFILDVLLLLRYVLKRVLVAGDEGSDPVVSAVPH